MDDTIRIVATYADDDLDGYVLKGEDSALSSASEKLAVRCTGELISTTPALIEKLRDFSEMMNNGLKDLSNDTGSGFYLDEIEAKIELTTKGELRLLASAGIESTGAITLKFKPRKKTD